MKYLLTFLGAITLTAQAVTTPPPNIVLVMADDQGWGDMAYNGPPDLKTPNFDAMAKQAVCFDQFHSAGCVPSAEQPDRVPQMREALENWLESFAKSLNGEDYK